MLPFETVTEGSPEYDGLKIGYMKTVAKSGLFVLKTTDRDRDGAFPDELFTKETFKVAIAGKDWSRK